MTGKLIKARGPIGRERRRKLVEAIIAELADATMMFGATAGLTAGLGMLWLDQPERTVKCGKRAFLADCEPLELVGVARSRRREVVRRREQAADDRSA